MSSTSPGKIVLDVVCGSLSAKLCMTDLYNGVLVAARVHLGSVILTPCEFERCAGRGTTRNRKKSNCFRGRPLSEFLELYTNSEERKKILLSGCAFIIRQSFSGGAFICNH